MGSSNPRSLAITPKRPFSASSKNPRRTDPASSKSLPRRKRVKIDQGSSDLRERTTSKHSPDSASLLPQESSSDQSATRWFDGVNENVVETRKDQSTLEGCDTHISASTNTKLMPDRGIPFLSCPAVNLQSTWQSPIDQWRELRAPSSQRHRK